MITVVAVAMSVTSRRGLPWTAFFAVCPACEHKRQFIRSGRRLCPCGTPLNVIPGAEVA